MTTFVAGPDYSLEFGWMVAAWIPAVRHKARKYDKTIVICKPGHEGLYEFADEFINMDKKGETDRWLINGNIKHTPNLVKTTYPYADFWYPEKEKCLYKPREYFKYGKPSVHFKYDVLIHARAETKYGQDKYNWSAENYAELIKQLGSVTVACIGHPKKSLLIPGAVSLRGMPLNVLVDVMAGAKVVVGTSSGPMHLASLCGTPHVVMTYDKPLKILGGKNNRYRYEKLWNPFDTPVTVIDKYGWKPPVEPVVNAVRKYLL